jgi:hypothetical protein
MADFALWATSCETALWPSGTFWSAYCGNRDEVVDAVIEADPIASAVQVMTATRPEWTGTASDLLGALAAAVGERVAKSKTFPDSPRALAGRLRRGATFLRKIGIAVSFDREGRARHRVIRITAADESTQEEAGTKPSARSESSAVCAKYNQASGLTPAGLRTVTDVRTIAAESRTIPSAPGR